MLPDSSLILSDSSTVGRSLSAISERPGNFFTIESGTYGSFSAPRSVEPPGPSPSGRMTSGSGLDGRDLLVDAGEVRINESIASESSESSAMPLDCVL